MNIPEDHVEVRINVNEYLYGPLNDVITCLKEISKEIIEPQLIDEGSYNYVDYIIVGYRPMNEQELEKAKRKRKLARETKKRQKEEIEQKEKEELKKLLKKYGDNIDV